VGDDQPRRRGDSDAEDEGAESFTGFEVMRKMIADMICGPAIVVMANWRIAGFMAPSCHRGPRSTCPLVAEDRISKKALSIV